MTTTMPPATPTAGLQSMQFVRGLLDAMMKTIPDDKLTHQPFKGANHALWIMGHMAWSDDYFVRKLTGGEPALPESWTAKFGNGSEPSDDVSHYPPIAEVRAAFEKQFKRVVEWVEGLDETTMNAPAPEGWEMMGPTNAFLPHFFAAHEAMHVGQMTNVRKSLGMKPINA